MKEEKIPAGIVVARGATGVWLFWCILGILFGNTQVVARLAVAATAIITFFVLLGLFKRQPWARWGGMILLGLCGAGQLWVVSVMIRESMSGITRIPQPIIAIPVILALGVLNVTSAVALALHRSYFVHERKNVSNKAVEGTSQ